MNYDIIIVGAGPAGLFCAYELCKKNGYKICLIDKGKSIKTRTKNEIMCGVGGAGTFSDGKLHFTPVLSHTKMLGIYNESEYQEILNYIDKIFTDFGVESEYYPKNTQEVDLLVDQCRQNGINLFVRKIRHVGSDILPNIITNFENFLIANKITLKTECEVKDFIIKDKMIRGVITKDNSKLFAKYVVMAPGRYNASWLQEIAKKHNLGYDYEMVEVGVRVEFPYAIMKKHSELMYEAIFMMHTPTFDDAVRTFCPCPNGLVAQENYEGFVCVNGHSNSTKKAPNSNFAFLSEIKLTEPVENTMKYARSIAQLATTIGGGKPILQRLKDLKDGRRSTWVRLNKSFVKPSLLDVTPGDISMALPHRVVTNILEGLVILNRVLPGIDSGNTLLYAPEIKLRSSRIKTDKYLQTSVKNLFVAGDGAGVSGNIVGAAATGIIAAQGILKK
jgi:uncharacterized FAD-dependent dehydrogenase